jgi:hypothetical protein
VLREDNVKVTLSLSRRSLDFFKREGKKRRVPYQRMIRAGGQLRRAAGEWKTMIGSPDEAQRNPGLT